MSHSQVFAVKDFETIVNGIFSELFTKEKRAAEFRKELIRAIDHSFHVKSYKISKIEKATRILEQLFFCLSSSSFSLRAYIERYVLKKVEIKHLLTTLLYGLYYGDIDLELYQGPNQKDLIESLILQIIATKNPATFRKIVSKVSLHKKLVLIAFAYENYREGSFFIFRELEALLNSSKNGQMLSTLISGLKRNYFDPKLFCELLRSQGTFDESMLSTMISTLSEHAKTETEEVYRLFCELIPLMFTFPERLFEEVEKLKASGAWEKGMFCITKEEVKLQKEHLIRVFKSYFTNNYALRDFHIFVERFGLTAYPPLLISNLQEDSKLSEKLHILVQLFSDSSKLVRISPTNAHQFYSFIIAIILHLDATCRNPSKYKEGMDHLAIAIATKGKALAKTPALLTLVQGLTEFLEFLRKREGADFKPAKYPIFVFDQSDEKTFSKNSKLVQKLNRQDQCAIVHISQKEALQLAEKINAEPLLNTTQKGSFGYGGARNCVFLLTGLLHAAYKSGITTHDELVGLDASLARNLFHNYGLGDTQVNKCGNSLFMVDDDMEIPAANVATAALFAKEFQNDYIDVSGYQLGRSTKLYLRFRNLNEALEYPENLFLSTQWLTSPTHTGLSEHVSKPKICLNIPNGNEEKHLQLDVRGHFFLQLSTHLGGSRYPTEHIPTSAFVGINESLATFIPYVFLLGLSGSLIDALNTAGRLSLPWNDRFPPKMFSNLKSVFAFIADERTKNELQRRFWKNVIEFFNFRSVNNEFMIDVRRFMEFEIDAYLKLFLKNRRLDRQEMASLKKIAKLYKFFQEDVRIFWQFGLDLIENISKYVQASGFSPSVFSDNGLNLPSGSSIDLAQVIEDTKCKLEKQHQKQLAAYPLTESMYLMALALGNGNFCKIIKNCLEAN